MNPLENTQYVTFQLVYKLSVNTFRTLGYLNKINKIDLDTLKSNLLLFHQNAFLNIMALLKILFILNIDIWICLNLNINL